MAGSLIKDLAHDNNAKILPVDSEHSAIFCLTQKIGMENISKIIITASGGPFRTLTKPELEQVTIEQALNHPTWQMGKKITIGDLEILPLRVMHGNLPIVGYRIGGLTYITDMKSMDEETFKLLKGTDTLVVNALHTKEHPTHQNVRQAVLFAQRVGARETYLIHMSHRAGMHAIMNGKFPAHIQFAYDGQEISII